MHIGQKQAVVAQNSSGAGWKYKKTMPYSFLTDFVH